ncbi:group II intron reverse transcriptase/maturase [Eubacteriales bacterium OttesenSCG-928-K08]|nr:group II intron reverse transcriptase/maturase [Eubacteriales bacterium OttesenSCG-928-K08]
MQNANTILSILNQKSVRNKQYVFDRLYRNMFNSDFFMEAYRKMYAKPGNMTAGTDGKTIDGFKKSKVDELITKLRNEQYYPTPVRRVYIPKKNSKKKRPLGIPSFEDKLVQEVVRKMLDAIYEPLFLDTSHGFRPNRSCQTALHQIKCTCRGTKWVVEGDITGCFDNVDHDILLQILSRKISDGRFLELIRRFLKAGYFEFHQVKNSLSGVPQGGIISPILSNIYMHEFDLYMELLAKKLTQGKKKKPNPAYRKLEGRRCYCLQKGWYEEAEELIQKMRKLPTKDQMDSDYARVKYVRYADDFVICVDGSKEMAEQIKNDVTLFLRDNLKLELNADKTLITNLKDERVRFLGYELSKSHDNTIVKKNSKGVKARSVNETIQLLVPAEVINRHIRQFTENGKAASFKPRVNLPVLDIINEYNSEIRGLYNYYSLATDVSVKLNKFKYYHYWSLLKTIAHKEKSTTTKVKAKYGIDVPRKVGTGTRKLVGVRYQTKTGEHTMTYFNESLKKVDEPNTTLSDKYCPDVMSGRQLINRLNANVCELCGTNEGEIEVHHVRKLKDIKDKYKRRGKAIPDWVLTMSRIRRKTLIVCECCHHNIHSGKY